MALIAVGLFGPWLQFTLGGVGGTSGVPGGTLLVLVVCLVGVGRGFAKRSRAIVIPFTLLAAAWIVFEMYRSPGQALHDAGTGGQVEWSWGAALALLGCAVIYASVWFPKPAPSDVAAGDDSTANLV